MFLLLIVNSEIINDLIMSHQLKAKRYQLIAKH